MASMVFGILDLTSVFSYVVLCFDYVLNINVCCLWLPMFVQNLPFFLPNAWLMKKPPFFGGYSPIMDVTQSPWRRMFFFWKASQFQQNFIRNPEVGYISIYIYIKNSRIVFFPLPGKKHATSHKKRKTGRLNCLDGDCILLKTTVGSKLARISS